MIASSKLNPITFKDLSGDYPNEGNTLHNDLKYPGKMSKPYYQLFQKNHVVYLQFESDLPDSLNLKAYHGTTEIESFTGAYTEPPLGTGSNIRYYTNFVVTLDTVYHDKIVSFVLTQTGSNPWTSEPIKTIELNDPITGKLDKRYRHVKYTNFARLDADVSSVFINWWILASTGYYMDFFVEAIDNKPNNKDESEVLEGSQSNTVISSVNYKGRVFETGPIPEYMIDRLALVSNLDVFVINDIQYIKSGGHEPEPFGGSTLYQLSMKLTQKNAIGINVDSLGVGSGSIIPPVSGTPMYVGSVTSAVPNETEVKLITSVAATKTNQTKVYTITNSRFCFAYPASFGSLTSILDNIGDEIISGFAIQTVNFTIGANTINFKIYTLKSPVTVTSFTVQFKF